MCLRQAGYLSGRSNGSSGSRLPASPVMRRGPYASRLTGSEEQNRLQEHRGQMSTQHRSKETHTQRHGESANRRRALSKSEKNKPLSLQIEEFLRADPCSAPVEELVFCPVALWNIVKVKRLHRTDETLRDGEQV